MCMNASAAPIFLSLESQSRIFLYLQVMFTISCCFNAIGLFLLVTQTPPSQAIVRKYLIAIQIILIVSDVHLEILFEPIPLFPVLGGVAVGLLPRAGFSVLTEMSITVVIYIYTGFVIMLCLIYRHQTVVLVGNPFKFREKTIHMVHFFMLISPPVPGILAAYCGNDFNTVERTIGEDPRNVSWIKDRGSYYVQLRSPLVECFIIVIICILVIGSLLVIAVFIHMLHELQKNRAKRSQQSIVAIRRSLLNLTAQLLIPMSLFVVPATIMFFGVLFEELLAFETLLPIYLVLPTHSIGHNLILLTITPTYRRSIVSCFQNPRLKCSISRVSGRI